jgi:hypothetical protein
MTIILAQVFFFFFANKSTNYSGTERVLFISHKNNKTTTDKKVDKILIVTQVNS